MTLCSAQLVTVPEGTAVCLKCQAVRCSVGGTFAEKFENRSCLIILVILVINSSLSGCVTLFQLLTFVLTHQSNNSLVNHLLVKEASVAVSYRVTQERFWDCDADRIQSTAKVPGMQRSIDPTLVYLHSSLSC